MCLCLPFFVSLVVHSNQSMSRGKEEKRKQEEEAILRVLAQSTNGLYFALFLFSLDGWMVKEMDRLGTSRWMVKYFLFSLYLHPTKLSCMFSWLSQYIHPKITSLFPIEFDAVHNFSLPFLSPSLLIFSLWCTIVPLVHPLFTLLFIWQGVLFTKRDKF